MLNQADPLKIAIVGTAPLSKMLAPYDDKSWQIWSCSGGNVDVLPRVNLWFELHPLNVMLSAKMKASSLGLYKWLKEKSEDGSFDVLMTEAGSANGGKINTYVPKALAYPIEEMVEKFGRNWFTSSVAYMMALAITRGANEIGLFGVDMAADQEHYEAQRAGCVRFIEIAEAKGIKVSIPPESCLIASPPMYGYSEGTPFGRRTAEMLNAVDGGIAQASAQEASSRDLRNYYSGSREVLRYMVRTWTDGTDYVPDMGFAAHLEANAPKVAPEAPLAAEKVDPGMAGQAMAARIAEAAETASYRSVQTRPNGYLGPAGEGG